MRTFLRSRNVTIWVVNVLLSVDYFRMFFFAENPFFEQIKSDWSKPKKAAIITVTAIIMVFGYCI